MEVFLPPDLVMDVSCYVVNEDSSFKSIDNDAVDITVCTCSGEVIEFSNKRILNSFQTELLRPTIIDIFYAYKPFMKFYIIQEGSDLLIIEKNKCMKELKLFRNVSRYEITDFLGFGFPQVTLSFHDLRKPLVTDFSNCWSENDRVNLMPQLRSKFTCHLDTQLLMMKMKVDEARFHHNQKRQCRTRALHNLSCKTSVSCVFINERCDFKNLDEMTEYNKKSSGRLKLETLWQRALEDCWLICIPVLNSAKSIAEDLQLHLISDDGELKYKSLVIPFEASENNVLQISNSMKVLPRSKSVIIGVIDIPSFSVKNSFTITGMLSYKVSDELSSDSYQINLPRLTLSTDDLVKGDNLFPFSNGQFSVQDLVAAMSIFEKTELEVIVPENIQDINIESIMDKLHYSKTVLENCLPCFVNNPIRTNGLSQSILFWKLASRNVFNLICYTRNEKQLLLLAHSLLNLLPHKSKVLKKLRPATCLDSAIKHLGNEISYLTESLRSHLLPCDGPLPDECELNFKANFWKELRQKLAAYELETDLAFQG